MKLVYNNKNINTTSFEGFQKIDIQDYGTKAIIDVEYIEYPIQNDITTSSIRYEKNTDSGNTRIEYRKAITPKSGIEVNFTINHEGIIEKGYIDFYTIKNSTTKRNGFYRLKFDNSLFKLYAITSRKNGYRKTISNYIVKDGITPEKLSTIIFRMIRIIENHAKKTNKNRNIESIDNSILIESLILLESSVKDIIQNILLYDTLNTEDHEDLKDFLLRYQGLKSQTL